MAFDGDAHPGHDVFGFDFGAQPHGVTDDDAPLFQLADAVVDGAARDIQLLRQRGDRQAGIGAQQAQQALI
ncbi:hypothetical protein G6F65_020885 [Rhizopus arrhizus]|nr:hypothetical protein G6F65_020885 [Rhizopus arrhizus]